jgi:hypothetical protein
MPLPLPERADVGTAIRIAHSIFFERSYLSTTPHLSVIMQISGVSGSVNARYLHDHAKRRGTPGAAAGGRPESATMGALPAASPSQIRAPIQGATL